MAICFSSGIGFLPIIASGHIQRAYLIFFSWLHELSYNNFFRTIPSHTQPKIFDAFSYIANLELNEAPVSQKCSIAIDKNEDDSENSWLCIEMRVGCSVASWGICGVLFFKMTSSHLDFRFINDVKDQCDYNVKSELRGLVIELENLQKDNVITGLDCVGSGGLKDKPSFELSDRPDKVFKEVNSLHMMSSSVLYEYSIERYSACKPFDLGLTWKFPVVWSCPRAPIHSSRFLMGSGNQRGTIAISFISTDLEEGFLGANIGEDSCKLQADIFQVVPWYIKVYYHTL
ncbi:hypothetical protein CFP56_012884 [Quercus suber]|uniref:Uncharacterized protein n=1 Tax=Quercus suber TaxID=58331 RepID=A0AAW0KV86_QUESU